MTRKDFIVRIEKCESHYEFDYKVNYSHYYLCNLILWRINGKAKIKFVKLFKPKYIPALENWFGRCSGSDNLEIRYFALTLFKEVCLSEKYYEEF